MLIWCERHCCYCDKECSTNIKIHHIDEDPSNDNIDNLVLLCSDCTDKLAAYNPEHTSGTKFSDDELKIKRELIYDKYTSKYVCPVEIFPSKYLMNYSEGRFNYQAYLNKNKNKLEPILRDLGDITCNIKNNSPNLSTKLRLFIIPYIYDDNSKKGEKIKTDCGTLYSGQELWNFKPNSPFIGHFYIKLPQKSNYNLRLEIFYSVIDKVEREHIMEPTSYILGGAFENWKSPNPSTDFFPHPTTYGKNPYEGKIK